MEHLLALLVEVTSVSASGKQLKRPIEVPRPKSSKPRPQTAPGQSAQDAAFKQGIGVLAATSKAVSRR